MNKLGRSLALFSCSILFNGANGAAARDSVGAQSVPRQARCSSLQTEDFSTVQDAPTEVMSASLSPASGTLPEQCQVKGYIAPAIGIRVFLPSGWNGKLLAVGCGGHCGILEDRYMPMACSDATRRGYACITSDMGHVGTAVDGLWAYNNLQAKIDWGYRATHVAALAGKAIVERYYGRMPQRSYFFGCSTGGRQGLQAAQRFPWDFDGIVAGAPPIDLSTIYMTFAWGIRAVRDAEGRQLLQKPDLELLTNAAVSKCDVDDGVRDGVIGNPLACSFDPSELRCKVAQTGRCLTPAQIDAVKKIYTGPMTSAGVRLSRGGPVVGSELGGWKSYLALDGRPPIYEKLVTNGFRFLFFFPEMGPAWTLSQFDFDRDYKRFGVMQWLYDSSNPDLRKFREAGGKLLVFQGLNDNSVLPRDTMNYYETVERAMGGAAATQGFFRLFMLPGVGHCTGGAGADSVDYLRAIEAWVEEGRAPDRLIAARVKDPDRRRPFWLGADPADTVFTRPVYPYPSMAVYKGRGDPNDAASFRRVQP